jgi:hypothetical protein
VRNIYATTFYFTLIRHRHYEKFKFEIGLPVLPLTVFPFRYRLHKALSKKIKVFVIGSTDKYYSLAWFKIEGLFL